MSGRIIIVGSGETSPTMVKLHRHLIETAGAGVRAMLDTPFGFQTNADDLTAKIGQYFAESVGTPIDVARWRRRDEPIAQRERTLALLAKASWVFAGPGSPSYALRQWQDTGVPTALHDLVRRGGTLVLGSAAAVTVGAFALPVYEIYKVGADPQWLPGLDVVGDLLHLPVAVVPHYDNREGGRHDTRYCYLGAERLTYLESLLPATAGILGVDEHTAAVFDLGNSTATVFGAGTMTLRHQGASEVITAGESVSFAEIVGVLAGEHAPHDHPVSRPASSPEAVPDATEPSSLRQAAMQCKADFDDRLAARDADGALAACLALEAAIQSWSADTNQSDERDVARRVLRAMFVDLAAAATSGLADPRALLGPVVEVALVARAHARSGKDFALSDLIRDGLAQAGIEVRDTPEGQRWEIIER